MSESPVRDATGRPVTLTPVDLDRFFSPRTVVAIGASDSPGRAHTSMWRKIRDWGRRTGATVIPVNPGRDRIDGERCYPSILDVPGDVDLAAILVGDAVEAFADVLEKKVGFAVVFSAGFAEAGDEGVELQRRLAALIDSGDTRVLGPNTNLNAFEEFRDDLPGRAIALVTQSGHQGRPVFQAQELGVRITHWAPTGNEADLEFADFAAWFVERPDAGAVAAYIEGFKDGRTLMLAADRAAQRGVPIVMVKIGRTDEGASTAQTHTGHLTGRDRVADGVFRQFGVHRVDGLDELADTATMLARSAPPSADGVCVYGISGGTAAHLADLLGVEGLPIPPLTSETQAALGELIPHYLRTSNPVDCGGTPVLDERGRRILDALVADPGIGALVCPLTGALPAMSEPLARDLVVVSETTDKPVCVIWGSPLTDDPAYRVLVDSQVPLFRTFRNCARALRAWFDHHDFVGDYRSHFDGVALARSPFAAEADAVLTAAAGPLSEVTSKQLLAVYGVDLPHELLTTSARQAVDAARAIGTPVVMKAVSALLAHKTDVGLVRIGVTSPADVETAWRELSAAAAEAVPDGIVDGVLVAEQLEGGVECIAGITQDPLFGPAVMFGLGGVHAEVLDDVAFRVPPFDRNEAARLVADTRASVLLAGGRGRPAADLEPVVDLLMSLQQLAVDHHDRLDEVDVNPLLVLPDRAVALDALVVTRTPAEVGR